MRKIRLQLIFTTLTAFVGFAHSMRNSDFVPNTNYCIPKFSNNTDYIKDVTTSGGITNLYNTNTGAGTNGQGYSNYINKQLVITQGTNASFNVNIGGWNNYLSIWIDKNNDGVFNQNNELVFKSLIDEKTHSESLNTQTLAPGIYRMRIVAHYDISSVSPCISSSFGEAEDYTIVVNGANSCLGTPNAGTITANPTTANAGSIYSVTSTNYDDKEGLTFVWQRYNETTSNWENFGSSTSEYQALTEQVAPQGVGTEVKYRLKVTCNNSNQTAYSNQATFTTILEYCVPITNLSDDYTSEFKTTNGITNANYVTTSQTGIYGYDDLSSDISQLITQSAGQNVHFTHTYEGEYGLSSHTLRIWVDWNKNGTFEDSEIVYTKYSADATQIGFFEISENTLAGDYRLRMRSRWNENVPQACTENGLGQVVDFTLNVIICPNISMPIGETTQQFTENQTIADLVVNGDNLVWYSDENLTTTLPTTTELVHNATYYVVNESGNCKSSALAITVINCQNIVSTPTGEENQNFNNGQTIANLVVNGDNLVWYSDEFFTDIISDSQELVNNTTYYVRSELDGCVSDVLEITVTQTVSLSDFDIYGFSYYPNPVNDVLHFSSNSPIEKVTISNMLGQTININTNSGNKSLDLSDLSNGNYFVKITIEGISKTIKIIKN